MMYVYSSPMSYKPSSVICAGVSILGAGRLGNMHRDLGIPGRLREETETMNLEACAWWKMAGRGWSRALCSHPIKQPPHFFHPLVLRDMNWGLA